MDIQDMLHQPRDVPPAGGVRYGPGVASQQALEPIQPEQQYSPIASRLSSVQEMYGYGKSRPARGEDNIIRVAQAKKHAAKAGLAASRLGAGAAANDTPGPGSRASASSQLADRMRNSPNSRYFERSNASELYRQGRRSSHAFLN